MALPFVSRHAAKPDTVFAVASTLSCHVVFGVVLFLLGESYFWNDRLSVLISNDRLSVLITPFPSIVVADVRDRLDDSCFRGTF